MSQGTIPAQQKRSQITQDKILTALDRMLKTRNFHDISVAEIGIAAGVSTAALYRRFKNKDALIPVLFDLQRQKLEQWVESDQAKLRLGSVGLKQALRKLARIAVRQLVQQKHVMKAMYVLAHTRPELIGGDWQDWINRSLLSCTLFIERYENEIVRPDSVQTASVLAFFFNTIFVERILFQDLTPDWGLKMDDDEFANEFADFAYGYLTTE